MIGNKEINILSNKAKVIHAIEVKEICMRYRLLTVSKVIFLIMSAYEAYIIA